MHTAAACAGVVSAVLVLAACGSSGSPGAPGGTAHQGGADSSSATATSGASSISSSRLETGGATSSAGGTTALTGTAGTGGLTVKGSTTGSPAGSGGANGIGGSTGAGGRNGTGGAEPTGGATNGGSDPSTGGSTQTGGTGAAAGGSGVAGNAPTGATTSSGGAAGSGGTKASGGAQAVGGTKGNGGTTPKSTAAGGSTLVGGATAVGGGKGTAGTSARPCGTTAESLKAAADCTGRMIGAALSTQHISESAYATAAREFNYVTPENEMKWVSNEPNRGQFSFSAGDQIVNFANSNGMKVKGHALVWHNQLPSWASSLNNATDTRAAMLAHIKGVVGHYKGKVHAWDVVNEAVSLDGKGMRDSPFYRYLGETFIDEAFQAARDADPSAKLYYNDYNCEGLTPKANKVYDLVKGMKERGVEFDGVGLQMHYGEPNEAVPLDDFVANMQRYADLDLDILISEMDVHVCAGLSPTQQQAIYHDIVAACVAQPRCIAVTFWGVNDNYSWLNDEPDLGCSAGEKPLGLLWDDSFKKKPAYTGVLNALLGL